MELTARDVNEKQFHDAWRGYNQEEVDDFLDKVAETLDRLERENSALAGRVRELDQMVEAAKSTEEMLKKTLVTAQQAAEEAIVTAKARADQMIQEAEERARRAREELKQRVATAEEEVRRRSAEVEREQAERQREVQESIDRLEAFERNLKEKLIGFFRQQSKLLESLNEREPVPLAETPVEAPERLAAPAPAVEAPAEVGAHAVPVGAPPQETYAPPGSGGENLDLRDPEMEDFAPYDDEEALSRRRGLRGIFRREPAAEEEWPPEA